MIELPPALVKRVNGEARPVRRPGRREVRHGVPRQPRRDAARGRHGVDLGRRALDGAHERDRGPVRRPRRIARAGLLGRESPAARSVGVDDEQARARRAARREHDLLAVGRPGRVRVGVARARELDEPAAVLADDVEVAVAAARAREHDARAVGGEGRVEVARGARRRVTRGPLPSDPAIVTSAFPVSHEVKTSGTTGIGCWPGASGVVNVASSPISLPTGRRSRRARKWYVVPGVRPPSFSLTVAGVVTVSCAIGVDEPYAIVGPRSKR